MLKSVREKNPVGNSFGKSKYVDKNITFSAMNTMPTFRRGRTVYVGDKKGSVCGPPIAVLIFMAVSWGVLSFLYYCDYNNKAINIVFDDIGRRMTSLYSDSKINDVVHFVAKNYTSSVYDHDFNLVIDNSLQIKRHTEYCQWQESSYDQCDTCHRNVRGEDGKTKRESYSCNCVRKYSYTKSWKSYRINSLLFDQPGAHFNPQRDPYPNGHIISSVDAAISDDVAIDKELVEKIRANTRPIVWTSTSTRDVKWYDFMWKYFGVKDRTRYDFVSKLSTTLDSNARALHNFVYAGDGYFFSPNPAESSGQFLFKKFVQFMEGSILDYQFGDLIPSCTAGDVRVYYTVTDPSTISGIGTINGITQGVKHVGKGNIIHEKTGIEFGVLHEGEKSAERLMKEEQESAKMMVYISRFVLLLWSIIPSYLIMVFHGLGPEFHCLLILSLTCLVNYTYHIWVVYAVDGKITTETIVYFGTSALFFILTNMNLSKYRPYPGGLGAVWRLICRNCGGTVDMYEAPAENFKKLD